MDLLFTLYGFVDAPALASFGFPLRFCYLIPVFAVSCLFKFHLKHENERVELQWVDKRAYCKHCMFLQILDMHI